MCETSYTLWVRVRYLRQRLVTGLHGQSVFGTIFVLEVSVDLETSIRPISQVKSQAAEMLRHVNETRAPIIITQRGEAKGVLVDPRSYQEMVDALGILKLISQSERSIELGEVTPHEELMTALRRRLD